MGKIGIRVTKDTNAKTEQLKNLSITSEARQWKVSATKKVFHTGSGAVVQAHGLLYTPFFLAYSKTSGNSYYQDPNTNSYVDNYNISISPNSGNGDITSYVILKDFGA